MQEKFEYRCTTRNLPLCDSTIIVLKIIPLKSVSFIIKFAVRKKENNKQETDKNITLFRLQPAQPTIPTILAIVIEEVSVIFAPLTFLI